MAVAEYVRDTSRWEEWQTAYQFGVLLIYPPEPLRSRVNGLRAQYDPKSRAICDAHISLTVPFPGPVSQDEWEELSLVAGRVPALTITYGPLTNYLPHPGIVLAVGPQDGLDELREALEGTSAFAGAPPRSHPFSAHMTIAEFITVERTNELMQELQGIAPSGRFVGDHVSLAVPDGEFRLEERARLELAH